MRAALLTLLTACAAQNCPRNFYAPTGHTESCSTTQDQLCSAVADDLHACKQLGYNVDYDQSHKCCNRNAKLCETINVPSSLSPYDACKYVHDYSAQHSADYVFVEVEDSSCATGKRTSHWSDTNCTLNTNKITRASVSSMWVDATDKDKWLYVAAGTFGSAVLLVLVNKFI